MDPYDIDTTEKWLKGCYGMNNPITMFTADAVVLRGDLTKAHTVEILLYKRSATARFEPGLTLVSAGGFVDPKDKSVLDAVKREVGEEIGKKVKARIANHPIYVGGPRKIRHRWDAKIRRAMPTNILAQDVPVCTAYYLAQWIEGGPETSDEVGDVWWEYLRHAASRDQEFAFDASIVFEHVVKAVEYASFGGLGVVGNSYSIYP